MSHTPEPWHQCDDGNCGCGQILGPESVYIATIKDKQNRERIVACVNACAGIPTEILVLDEKTALASKGYIDQLRNDKAVLLSDLNKIASHTQDTNLLWWQKEARKAIDAVKGVE